MYDTIWQVIQSGDYSLTDLVNKINVFWAEGQLTDTERSGLLTDAKAGIDPSQETPELAEQVKAVAARVTALETAVAALQSGGSSGGDDSGGSETTYPEWTSWDGLSTDYQQGAIVSHNGRLWKSVFAGQNVWEPGAAGTEALWAEYTE